MGLTSGDPRGSAASLDFSFVLQPLVLSDSLWAGPGLTPSHSPGARCLLLLTSLQSGTGSPCPRGKDDAQGKGGGLQNGYLGPSLGRAPWTSLFQVVFPDAAGMDSREQPSSAPGGPEKGPRPRESSEEGPLELRTQQQMHPAGPR